MKKLIVVVFNVMVLLVSGLMVGCGFVPTGSGDLETEEYDFGDFNKVEISGTLEFEISRSSAYSISVTADDNVIEKVFVTKRGDTLKIDLETFPRLGSITLKTVITMPQLRGLDISGAARGTIYGFNSTDDVHIRLSGASKVEGNIIAGNADFDVGGASIIQLEGSAKDMVADVIGASYLRLGDFTVNNASITLMGVSTGTVNVSGRLDADLQGVTKLSYIGEPVMGTIKKSAVSVLIKK
ncbi:head GIN domain-containing protein [Chloroflexota bacterium]